MRPNPNLCAPRFSALTVVLVAAGTASIVAAGSSWAATKITARGIAKNAVTTSHIKNSTIRSADIKNGTIAQVDINPKARAALKGQRGERGEQGATGPQGAAGATGPAGPLLDTLPSGRTLTGTFAGHAPDRALIAISYQFPLAQAPTSAHYVKAGSLPPFACPGSVTEPTARPGRLCVYGSSASVHGTVGICPVTLACVNSLERFGAIVDVQELDNLNPDVRITGSWSVTAH